MADADLNRKNKKARHLTDGERARLDEFVDSIQYSNRYSQRLDVLTVDSDYWRRYSDNTHEYRHVQLPKAMLKAIPRDYFDPAKGTLKLLWEEEWRGLGITQVYTKIPLSSTTNADEHFRVWDGNTMKCTNPSHTSCYSSKTSSSSSVFPSTHVTRRPINYQPPQ